MVDPPSETTRVVVVRGLVLHPPVAVTTRGVVALDLYLPAVAIIKAVAHDLVPCQQAAAITKVVEDHDLARRPQVVVITKGVAQNLVPHQQAAATTKDAVAHVLALHLPVAIIKVVVVAVRHLVAVCSVLALSGLLGEERQPLTIRVKPVRSRPHLLAAGQGLRQLVLLRARERGIDYRTIVTYRNCLLAS